jgi:hypothetical protein
MAAGRGIRVVPAVLAAVMACAGTASAQEGDYEWALPEWRQTWSGGPLGDDRGFVTKATDDAVYVAGVSGSGKGGGDLLVQRYSPAGDLVWSQTWGGHELDQAQSMVLASDGIYVVGSDGSSGDGVNQSVLLRFEYESGALSLERTWNAGLTSQIQAVAEAGRYLYVAGLSHRTRGNRDAYVAKIRKSDGSRVWQRRWGGDQWDEAWDIQSDGKRLYVLGYTTDAELKTTDNLLLILRPTSGAITRAVIWGGPGNDEARAGAIEGSVLWVAGGGQVGTSGDAFLSRVTSSGHIEWTRYAGRRMTGAYGIAIGERGIYLAGGSYDFPAGGDMAVSRWSREGVVEWSQIYGLPGFWDWAFDVDARGGRFYVTGTLWTPGTGWYEVLTIAYDEHFDTVALPEAVQAAAGGDRAALEHFQIGDMLKWARGRGTQGEETSPERPAETSWESTDPESDAPPAGSHGAARLYWSGASDFGREQGAIWADTARDPAVGQEGAVEALTGLQRDFPGNPALVRNYTGFRGSALDGLIRFRYFISHDRLIPQGGFISVGDTVVPLPPPPV